MEVLGLCSYPLEAASTRYRLIQYVVPLAEKGINLTVLPFLNKKEFASLYQPGRTFQKAIQMLNSARKRLFDTIGARRFDALLIQREAMIFGPPIFEWLSKTIGNCPLILDLDDATYVRYISPTYGRLGSALKFFGKTDTLINWSETVICGNRYIAEYVAGKGKKTIVVPTVVDTDKFYPIAKDIKKVPVVGWIGTHSTYPLLEKLFPVLQNLAQNYKFTVKIVGAGRDRINIGEIEVENSAWTLENEIKDFQSLDIGLYPLEETGSVSKEWILGKSGFKAIQYMSVGIPFVVSPIGVCAEIGIDDKTHFSASSKEEWYDAIAKLLESFELRNEMGKEGRKYSLNHYSVPQQTEKIAETLHQAIENSQ